MNLGTHVSKWNELCLDVVKRFGFDGYTYKLRLAIEESDLSEMDHLSAVVLTMLAGRGEDVSELNRRWGELDREFHARYCQDERCVTRRATMKEVCSISPSP